MKSRKKEIYLRPKKEASGVLYSGTVSSRKETMREIKRIRKEILKEYDRLEELNKEHEENEEVNESVLQEFCVQTGQPYLQDLQNERDGE